MDEQTSELGDKPSLEDRVAQKYGLLSDDQSDEPEQTEQPEVEEPELPEEGSDSGDEAQSPFEEVEFEGKVYQVPTELKNALMAKADYTQKTQEVARNRENLELHQKRVQEFIQQQQFEQGLRQEFSGLQTLEYQIEQYKKLNWAELPDAELTRRHLELQQLKERREEMQGQLQAKREQFAKEQEQRLSETLEKAQEILRRSIPNWNESIAAEISEYALSKGYTQHEVSNVTNPRDVETLWKAYQYDKLQSTKGEALKKASKAPPVVKPGSVKPMPKGVKDMLNYRKAMAKANKSGARDSQKAEIIRKRLETKFGG